jgi:hypothetical protein
VEASDDLRGFFERVLGWAPEHAPAVEHAMQSVDLAVSCRAALVLLGEVGMIPLAHAIHRRVMGSEPPFVVVDLRRGDSLETIKSPASYESGVEAFKAARGGTLCIHRRPRPKDYSEMVARLRGVDDVMLIVCGAGRDDSEALAARPVPVRVPSLRTRTKELPRIVKEYARDAIAELRARDVRPPEGRFTERDRRWVLERCPMTLEEFEKATLRLMALKMSRTLPRAADRLGMAPVSLERWVKRRRPLPPLGLVTGGDPLDTDVEEIDGPDMDDEERAEFQREMDASFEDEENGRLIDAADFIADLKAHREKP